MTEKPFRRLLLTNDDGIDALGLAVLREVAATLADSVWVVAPDRDQSGVAQALSLNSSLEVVPRGHQAWAVRGTPADCVALAIGHFMADHPPDAVFSGVNAGANLGDEINISGTIGAALTARMLGFPALALSQKSRKRHDVPWEVSRQLLPEIFDRLLAGGLWDRQTCLAVSMPVTQPDQPVLSWARPRRDTLAALRVHPRKSPRERDYYWIELERRAGVGERDSDGDILARGEISLMKLGLDRSLAA